MPDETPNQQNQQGQQGAGQEHGQEHEPGQAGQDQGQGAAGAQEPITEVAQGAAGDRERDQHPANAEAAKYRRALRSAEARLEQYDRQTVERLAADRLANPADAWLVIGSLDELRDDDGVLDASKVEEGLARIVQERPHWAAPRDRMPDLHQGTRREAPRPPSFGQALKGGGQ